MGMVEEFVKLLYDQGIIEIMLNEDGAVYIERVGHLLLEKTPLILDGPNRAAALKSIAGEVSLGPNRPYADLVGLEGSRVHALTVPIVKALCLTIRKRPQKRPSIEEMAAAGTLSASCANFLLYAVAQRKNIIICGGTSSGKTTLLNALGAHIPNQERILVLEDTPELRLPQSHVMYLRTRIADQSGLSDVTLRELVINTLRMRPDRLIVGECRGAEAADMLGAMNVGQEGMLTTLHASSAREVLLRLETLVLTAGLDMPLRAVKAQIATAIDLIVFMARLADGKRHVVSVSEVTGIELENITLSDLFSADVRKTGKDLSVTLKSAGARPKFYDQLRREGFEPPMEFFKD
jgi:pilus assembly protein CpaF